MSDKSKCGSHKLCMSDGSKCTSCDCRMNVKLLFSLYMVFPIIQQPRTQDATSRRKSVSHYAIQHDPANKTGDEDQVQHPVRAMFQIPFGLPQNYHNRNDEEYIP